MASRTLSSMAPIAALMFALLVAPACVFAESGQATFYDPFGIPTACGRIYSSSFYGAAVGNNLFNLGGVFAAGCGTYYQVVNTANGRAVTVEVVDACPFCESKTGFDLFVEPFRALADLSVGIININFTRVL